MNRERDYLIVYSRIIKISSEQKKQQYRTHNVFVENGEQKHTCKNNRKHEIPEFTPLKFFSIVDKHAHRKNIKNKRDHHNSRLIDRFKQKYYLQTCSRSDRSSSSNLFLCKLGGMTKDISDFFFNNVWIAHNVFLLNGANNSRNSMNLSRSMFNFPFLTANCIKALLTLGAGLKHFAGTHLRYFTS